MSSAAASYANRAADLYAEIYGSSEPERHSDDAYTQNNMELFEKVWVAGGGAAPDDDSPQQDSLQQDSPPQDITAAPKQQQQQQQQQQRQHGAETPPSEDPILITIPSDWLGSSILAPPPTLWTCDVCGEQVGVLFRTEHIERNHPPPPALWTCDVCGEQVGVLFRAEHTARKHPPPPPPPPARRPRRKKQELDANTPTWHCELCEEDVNIFYTAEHTAGKKHVARLKESGDYSCVQPSDESIEERAVYRPQHGEEVLAPEEGPVGAPYQEHESAVYRPEEVLGGQDDWESDGYAATKVKPKKRATRPPKEEEDWELVDKTVHRPLAGEHWGWDAADKAQAPPAGIKYTGQSPAGMQFSGKSPAGMQFSGQQSPAQQYPAPAQRYPAQQYRTQQYAGQRYPVQQHPAQQYPLGQLAAGQLSPPQPSYQQPLPKEKAPHAGQGPVHIQVETFYCDLCDTEYPTSEEKNHPDATLECAVCDEVYHVNNYAAHMASLDHMENARTSAHTPKVAMPPFESLQNGLRFHCDLCQKSMALDSRESHLAGSKHKAQQQELAAAQAARLAQQRSSRWTPQTKSEPAAASLGRFGAAKMFYCALCQTSVKSETRGAHLASDKHRERVAAKPKEQFIPSDQSTQPPATATAAAQSRWASRRVNAIFCEPCQRSIGMNSWENHAISRKHKENLEAKGTGAVPQPPSNTFSPARSTSSQFHADMFYCRPCGTSMHVNNRESHMNGLKHIEVITGEPQGASASQRSSASNSGSSASQAAGTPQSPARADFHCRVCNIKMPALDRQSHLSGKTHQKNELENAPRPRIYTTSYITGHPRTAAAAGQSSTGNVATEMVVTKVDGDLVVEVSKTEPDRRMEWCGVCEARVMQAGGNHRSEAWTCPTCSLTTHSAWKDLHLLKHKDRKSGGAYRFL